MTPEITFLMTTNKNNSIHLKTFTNLCFNAVTYILHISVKTNSVLPMCDHGEKEGERIMSHIPLFLSLEFKIPNYCDLLQ